MQGNYTKHFRRTAAFSVAAFVLCFAFDGAAHIVAAKSDKKAYNKGYRAVRKGEYEEAERIFRDLITKDAHDNDARLGLSFALLKQRNLQGAYDNAARVIMSDPLSARAHALLGSAILGAGEFRILWNVALPLVRPALLSAVLLTFIGPCNEFLWPFLVT